VGAEGPITGPSFLGLSDPEPQENSDLAYLYEDEGSPGRARFWIAALVVVAFVGFITYEWRLNPEWQNSIVARAQQLWQRPKSGPAARPPASPAAGSSTQPLANSPADGTAGSTQGPGPQQEAAINTAGQSGNQSANDKAVGKNIGDASSAEPVIADEKKTDATMHEAPSPAVNHEDALVTKAEQYLYGRGGTPKNCDQALVYLRAAADNGNAAARSKLGGLYATGNCVPLDRARAYNWFTRARQSGDRNIWIERNMSMLWNEMTPEERSRTMVGR
jgi:hypothetical protein